MIDMIIFLITFSIFILIELTPMFEDVKIFIKLIIISSLLFYVGFNIGDYKLSRLFLILGLIITIAAIFIIIIKQLDKIFNK